MIATYVWQMRYTCFNLKGRDIIHLKRLKRKNYHCLWIWIGNRLFNPKEYQLLKRAYKLITKDPNKQMTINEDIINRHSLDFIDFPTSEFVIKFEQEHIYIDDFEMDGIGKYYHIELRSVNI